jgi:isoquinoline 1-oxidoreductase subunit beta
MDAIAITVNGTVENDGKVRVDRVTSAVDCGQVINPDMVAAQIEGGIVFGLTVAKSGEITFEGGETQQSNFNNYPMLRIAEMRRVEVHIAPSHESPGGCGEPHASLCDLRFAISLLESRRERSSKGPRPSLRAR